MKMATPTAIPAMPPVVRLWPPLTLVDTLVEAIEAAVVVSSDTVETLTGPASAIVTVLVEGEVLE